MVTVAPPLSVALSTSATVIAASITAAAPCSVYASVAPDITVGASLTAVTLTDTICVRLGLVPSFATTLTVRLVVVGASLVLLYWIPCRIVW